ncbi:hypothetical protein [Cupriavidus sp. CP313]
MLDSQVDSLVSAMASLAINPASARNRRRALRRHARRLRLRRDYIQHAVADGRDDVIDIWIAATRANAGRLPAGLISDPVLAAAVEKAITLPWRLIPPVPARWSHRATRTLNADGAVAVGKQIAKKMEKRTARSVR